MSEPENMPGDPNTDVDICRHDDGSIVMVFGAGTPASDLATAFASLPRDAWMPDITKTWFSEQNDCEGQDVPDDGPHPSGDHHRPDARARGAPRRG